MRYDVIETPIPPPGEKWCPGCEKSHKFAEFYTGKDAKLSVYCKVYSSVLNRAKYVKKGGASANRSRLRVNNLMRLFNLSDEQYDIMFKSQGGVCAACGNTETTVDHRTNLPRKLAVDHCHVTGRIRGLLCSGCNLSLGALKEDIDRIRALERYLLRYKM